MSLPELPDHRRAQPRRVTAADVAPRDERHGRGSGIEPERRPVGRHALAPGPLPPAGPNGRGAPGGRVAAVGQHVAGGQAPANGRTASDGHAGTGGRAGTDGRAGTNGRAASGRAGTNGQLATNGRAIRAGAPARNGRAGPDGHASANGRTAASGRSPGSGAAGTNGWIGSPALPRTSGTPARPAVPAPRSPVHVDPDDEPTEVHDPVEDDRTDDAPAAASAPAPPASTEVPGRHRRRAGQSAQSRPAAEYKAQAEAARGGRKVRPGRRRRENFWRELPLLIVVALLMTFLIQTFLAKVYVIPSGSMETTLHGCNGCNNDRVLVDKVTYRFTDPSPGDVVVFRGPDSWTNTEFSVPDTDNGFVNALQQFGSLIGLAPPDEKDFVKRVIAVGGQTVQCCDSRNRILVDDEPLDEPYIFFVEGSGNRQEPFDPVTVPEGQLWMMGDSRNNSADSTAPGHGPVPVENVIGQARLIVLPFPRFGWIPSIDPHPDAVGMADDVGVPMALGLIGTPLLVWQRRRNRRDEELRFLP